MEENQTVNPINTPEVSVQQQVKNNLPKILLLVVLGLILLAGAVYTGIQIGKKQVSPFGNLETPPSVLEEPTPTESKETPPTSLEVSPTPDVTADWKTYTESQYGLSFEYQSQSSVDKSEHNSINGGKEVVLKSLYGGEELNVFIDDNEKKVSLEAFSQQSIDSSGATVDQNKTIGEVKGILAEFPGYKGQLDADNAHLEFYMAGTNNHLFRFRLYTNAMTISQPDKDLFYQILSTIKLAD